MEIIRFCILQSSRNQRCLGIAVLRSILTIVITASSGLATFAVADTPGRPTDPLSSPLVKQAVKAVCAPGSPVASCLAGECQGLVAKSIVECFDIVPPPAGNTQSQQDEAFSKLAKCAGRRSLSKFIANNGINERDKNRCQSAMALATPSRPREDVVENLELNVPILLCKEKSLPNACFSGEQEKCNSKLAPAAQTCRNLLEARLQATVPQELEGQTVRPFAGCILKTYRSSDLTEPCRAAIDYRLMSMGLDSKAMESKTSTPASPLAHSPATSPAQSPTSEP